VIEQRSTKAATNLASIFFYLVPESGPDGTGIPQHRFHHWKLGLVHVLLSVDVDLDPTLQQTPKVLRNVDVPGQATTADTLVGLDPSKSVIVVIQTTTTIPLTCHQGKDP
jgi:hypothetical protein